ncbi:major facilitator superfamily domain-containing protein [Aspergillus undulatus]|uniref:major facilitator superfamily domain-containing protein n=1 Tax=Aspergillus undulatus TaxID=1810928 RepID=UPI003CCE437C
MPCLQLVRKLVLCWRDKCGWAPFAMAKGRDLGTPSPAPAHVLHDRLCQSFACFGHISDSKESSDGHGNMSLLGVIKEVFNWYPSALPSDERKLLFKLDVSILVYACLCFFVKFLDQTNISNAYASGLKEDFGLYGNELNYFNVCYYSAYVLFQVPGMLLMSRPVLAHWLLPGLEILWGNCTFAQNRVTNVRQLYALRFLVGMFEAPVFAGTHFILGSWYSGPEHFKRAGTWWLFIVDGIFTILVALIGFVIFPGIPDSPQSFFITKRDVEIAKDRINKANIRRPGRLDLNVFKRSFRRWHIWILFCYACMTLSSYPSSYMNLWLKAEGYSVTQINQLPTVTYAIQIVASWLGTTLASIYSSWIIYTLASFFAWFLFGISGCLSPILYSTVNTIVKDDSEERALIMGGMMTFGYQFQIWVPLLIFPTAGPDDAPRWRKGWPLTFVFFFLLWVGFIASLVLHRRDKKWKGAVALEEGSDSVGSGVETEIVVENAKSGEARAG